MNVLIFHSDFVQSFFICFLFEMPLSIQIFIEEILLDLL